MQNSKADLLKGCQLGTEERLIRFRPSTNFKNMKKFFLNKSKIDFTESNQSPLHGLEQSPTNTSPEPITTLEEQRALLEKAKPSQPPLPLEPPPCNFIEYNLLRKQEIEDPEYESKSGSPTLSHQGESLALTNYEPQPAEISEPEKPKKTICRDFIRGTCTRVGCRYAHERDVSQLVGVYTFCKNFQNTVCTFPYCKYVHATIFEEQRFYRTGVLPPHALAHHKKPPTALTPGGLPPAALPPPVLPPAVLPSAVLPPPVLPPPPPPPPPEEPAPVPPLAIEVPMFLNPPPPLVPSVDKSVITSVPAAHLESRPIDDFIINPALRDRDLKAKKCKNCDTMEFRQQFNKDKAENMRQSTIELKKKVALLTKKTHTLYSILWGLINTQTNKRPEGVNGLSMSTLLNFMGDSEKNALSSLLLKESLEQNLVSEARDS